MIRRSTTFATLLALLLVQGQAFAEPNKQAENLFRDARKLIEAKDYAAACAMFAESQKLEPAPGTLLNLADCYEKNGQTASAWSTFKEASAAAAARNRNDWVTTANQHVADLEKKLSRMTLNVAASADVPGLHVERDGVNIPRTGWGKAVPIDPGPHVFAATAKGRKPFTQRLDVIPGQILVIDLPQLEADGSAAATPVAPVVTKPPVDDGVQASSSDGDTQRIIGYVALGVGAVGIGVGTFLGVKALDQRSQAADKCESYPDRCSPEASALNDDAKKSSTIATIALIGGGALVVGGLVLVLIAPTKTDTKAGLRLHPIIGSVSGVGGTF